MTLVEEVRIAQTLPPAQEARAIRLEAGVTIDRLAQELGVSRGALAKWEHGSRRPRGASLVRYAKVIADLQAAIGRQ